MMDKNAIYIAEFTFDDSDVILTVEVDYDNKQTILLANKTNSEICFETVDDVTLKVNWDNIWFISILKKNTVEG